MADPAAPDAPQPVSAPFATHEEEAWHTFRRQSEQETPRRLEEAAKYLSGIISIVFTILSTRDPEVFQRQSDSAAVTAAGIFLLLALVSTLFVIFPLRWSQVSQSAGDIERAHRASVQYKYRLLLAGAALFFVALGVLCWVFVRRG